MKNREDLAIEQAFEEMHARVKREQKRLGVTDEDVWGMIDALIKAGYGKSCFAFLTCSGQTYSLAFDEAEADLYNRGEIK